MAFCVHSLWCKGSRKSTCHLSRAARDGQGRKPQWTSEYIPEWSPLSALTFRGASSTPHPQSSNWRKSYTTVHSCGMHSCTLSHYSPRRAARHLYEKQQILSVNSPCDSRQSNCYKHHMIWRRKGISNVATFTVICMKGEALAVYKLRWNPHSHSEIYGSITWQHMTQRLLIAVTLQASWSVSFK